MLNSHRHTSTTGSTSSHYPQHHIPSGRRVTQRKCLNHSGSRMSHSASRKMLIGKILKLVYSVVPYPLAPSGIWSSSRPFHCKPVASNLPAQSITNDLCNKTTNYLNIKGCDFLHQIRPCLESLLHQLPPSSLNSYTSDVFPILEL